LLERAVKSITSSLESLNELGNWQTYKSSY